VFPALSNTPSSGAASFRKDLRSVSRPDSAHSNCRWLVYSTETTAISSTRSLTPRDSVLARLGPRRGRPDVQRRTLWSGRLSGLHTRKRRSLRSAPRAPHKEHEEDPKPEGDGDDRAHVLLLGDHPERDRRKPRQAEVLLS